MTRTSRIHSFVVIFVLASCIAAFGQEVATRAAVGSSTPSEILYPGSPSHRAIAIRALQLAIAAGFSDTSIGLQELQGRLEAGAYSEDYDPIPGAIGAHYPAPWNQGPQFDFNGWYPFSRIPYGGLDDSTSGWIRGLPHAYDPVQNFLWPGARETTVGWANSSRNSFTWDNAKSLYRLGRKADAYECLGHLLHLLADMSVPQHVKIVGAQTLVKKSGTLLDPDIAVLVADEFQMAVGGGLVLPGPIAIIPDLSGEFTKALSLADTSKIPHLASWDDYLKDLATYTYYQSDVQRFYVAPTEDGQFGRYRDEGGNIVAMTEYFLTPPSKVGDRWTQISLRSTARVGTPPNIGPIIPEASLRSLCDDLVPRAAEYCAGLMLQFIKSVTSVTAGRGSANPPGFSLAQNYPNPFNPRTTITYQIPRMSHVVLSVYDPLGRLVATVVDEVEGPGSRVAELDASTLSSGVYFYRLSIDGYVATRKMIVAK